MRCFLYKLRIIVLFLWKELGNGVVAELPYGIEVVPTTRFLVIGEVLFVESFGYSRHCQSLIMCLVET